MLATLNTPYLTFAAFVLFIALAIASEPFGHGYSEKERAQMDDLLERVTAPQSPEAKVVYLFGEE